MKQKSLSSNVILNMIKTFTTIGFPLITFPYVSRILQVENLGKVNFSISIISYFSLIATLGINSYAIREGAIVRNNTKERTKLFNEIFSLNIITTIIAYIMLIISIYLIGSLREFKELIYIYSITMFFNTIGVGWACSVFEDYLYITIRSIVIQIISLIMIFVLIRNGKDYYMYLWIMTVQIVGANILNFIHISKKHKFKFTFKINLKKHIKSVLTLFATEIATTIYVSSDTTIIGLLVGNYYNGLYAVSSKIYRVMKQMLASILQVAIPRLSHYYNNGEIIKFEETLNEISSTLIVVLMPIVTGMFFCSKPIIVMLSGKEYESAYISLRILSISLIFAIIAWFLSQCVLIPKKEEKLMLKVTTLSAFVNLILNLMLIPYGQHNAAAITTMISEGINAYIFIKASYSHLNLKQLISNLFQCGIACLGALGYMLVIDMLYNNYVTIVIHSIVGTISIYSIILWIFKNKVFIKYVNVIKKKFMGIHLIKYYIDKIDNS